MEGTSDDPSACPRARAVEPLDPSVLRELVGSFGTPCVALRFVRDYLDLVGPRTSRVRAGLAGRRPDEAEVALLSLRGSSVMVGAPHVAELCTQLLGLVLAGRWEPAGAVLPDLLAEVEEAADALREWAERGGTDQGRAAASR